MIQVYDSYLCAMRVVDMIVIPTVITQNKLKNTLHTLVHCSLVII